MRCVSKHNTLFMVLLQEVTSLERKNITDCGEKKLNGRHFKSNACYLICGYSRSKHESR